MIGASAGGVEALSRLVALLPSNLPASILVVVHFPQKSTSVLPQILNRNGSIPAVTAEDGLLLKEGQIYCAPPGVHLLVSDNHIVLVKGPKENGSRPAIDPLFRSAAQARKNRVISIILSGLLDDGTVGTLAVRNRGGITICQDPEDALFGDMPKHAAEAGGCDKILTLDEIAETLVRLVGTKVPEPEQEAKVEDEVEMTLTELSKLESKSEPSTFVCPECHGTLFKLTAEGVPYYRCRVGHSYLPDSLAENQEEVLEAALWTAMRAVKEHDDLLHDLSETAETRGHKSTAKQYRVRIDRNEQRLVLLRRVLGVVDEPLGES